MSLPLQGIRIIDWTVYQLGPAATQMLADLGADVIKVEPRVAGDPGRGVHKIMGITFGITGKPDYFFGSMNRNKRSVTIDLTKEEGRRIMYELVAKSDVFVQNWSIDVAPRLGMDYETLKKHNPKLIYAYGSGYGSNGPDAGVGSFDITGAARSGLMTVFSEPGQPPAYPVGAMADQAGAMMLSYGILTALLARERLGVGQKVDVSQLGAMVQLQASNVSMVLAIGMEFPRKNRTLAGNPLWNFYRCSDDKWLCLAMYQSDRYWPDFCVALEIPEYLDDPRFNHLDGREKNCTELIGILDRVFATKTREEWVAVFKNWPHFVYAPINTITELVSDPQVIANRYVERFDHPQFGPIDVLGVPVQLSETPGQIRTPAPELGQHTEEVLVDLLGYDWDEIVRLRDAEVI